MENLKKYFEAEKPKVEEKKGVSKWCAGLVLGVLTLLVLGWFYFQAWKKGKELAKLKHEKDKLEQHKAVDAALQKVSKNEALVEIFEQNIRELEKEIDKINVSLHTVEEEYNNAKNAINSISSWDDVDKHHADSNR